MPPLLTSPTQHAGHPMTDRKRGGQIRNACKRGHPFNSENTRLSAGHKQCRVCDRLRRRYKYEKVKVRKNPLWTQQELERLKELWPTKKPLREMSEILHRSISSISHRALKLGLPSRLNGFVLLPGTLAPGPKVTRRCSECLGWFETTPGGYEHIGCPRQRVAA